MQTDEDADAHVLQRQFSGNAFEFPTEVDEKKEADAGDENPPPNKHHCGEGNEFAQNGGEAEQ